MTGGRAENSTLFMPQGGVTGNALPHSIQVDPGVGEAAVVFERLPFEVPLAWYVPVTIAVLG